ncbi:hypothetical protein [Pseudomonas fluorescens]|uniref:hypothetical protein n=1 Tax=Pseudomonas fluorescens TaxID=294 RepID=UPI00177B4592|nr:hypothetical protein [Pseudomonas fluorescens]
MNNQQTSPQSWLSNLRIVVGSSTPLLYDNGNQQVPIVLIVAPAPGQEVSREQLDSLTLVELTQDGYKALATEPNAQGWRYSLERDLRFDYHPHGLDPVGADADWAKPHSGEMSKTVYVHADAPAHHALRLVAKIHRDKDTEYFSDHDAYRSSVALFASAAPECRFPQDYKWKRTNADEPDVNGSFIHEYLLEANFRKFVAVTLPDPASKLLVHEYSGQASGKLTTQVGLADSFKSSGLKLHQPDNTEGIVVRLQSDGQLAGAAALVNDERPFTFTALDNYGSVHQITLSLEPDQPNPLSVTAIAGINDHSLEAWLSRFTIEAGADGNQVDNDGEQHIAIKVIVEPAAGQQITDEQFDSLVLYEVKPDGVYRPLPASPKAEGWRYSPAFVAKPTGDALLAGTTRCKEFYVHTKAPANSFIDLVARVSTDEMTHHYSDHADWRTRLSVYARSAPGQLTSDTETHLHAWLSEFSIHVTSAIEQLYNNGEQPALIELFVEANEGETITEEQLNSLTLAELTPDGTYRPLLEDSSAAWRYSKPVEESDLNKASACCTKACKKFYVHTQAAAYSSIDLVGRITKNKDNVCHSVGNTFHSMVTLTAKPEPTSSKTADTAFTSLEWFQVKGMGSETNNTVCPVYTNGRHQTRVVVVVGAVDARNHPVQISKEELQRRVVLIDYDTGVELSTKGYAISPTKGRYDAIVGSSGQKKPSTQQNYSAVEFWVSTQVLSQQQIGAKITSQQGPVTVTFATHQKNLTPGGKTVNGQSNSSATIYGITSHSPFRPENFILLEEPHYVAGNFSYINYRISLPQGYQICYSDHPGNPNGRLHVRRRNEPKGQWTRLQTAWSYGKTWRDYINSFQPVWGGRIRANPIKGQANAFRFAAHAVLGEEGGSAPVTYHDTCGVTHFVWVRHLNRAIDLDLNSNADPN